MTGNGRAPAWNAGRPLTEAELEQRRQAHTTHGLTSAGPLPAPMAPAVRALGSHAALVEEANTMHSIAVWVANELREEPPLSQGERMALLYADVAGRCNEAAVTIGARRFTHRYRDAARAAPGAAETRQAVIDRQSVVAAFVLGKAKGAYGWLRANGVRAPDGKLRPVLRYYGEYLERARRNCLVLAAMLLGDDGGDGDAEALLAQYRPVNHDNGAD